MRSENQTRIIQGDSMDENNRNIRVVKTGGRKVTKTTTEYDWSRLEKRTLKEHKDVPDRSVRREPTQLERKIRYQKNKSNSVLKYSVDVHCWDLFGGGSCKRALIYDTDI